MFRFRPQTCDWNVYYSVVELNEYRLPEKFASTDVIIDVGAHIGSFAWACLQRGAGLVVGFETDCWNLELAREHLAEYGPRVRLSRRAVWRSDRPATELWFSGYAMAPGELNTGGGNVHGDVVDGENEKLTAALPTERVTTIALDEVLREFPQVRLLKLDCEGSEWPILLTSSELGRVEAVCGEFHLTADYSWLPASRHLNDLGQLNMQVLETFLLRYFGEVQVCRTRDGLGHFWASQPQTRPVGIAEADTQGRLYDRLAASQ